MAKCERFAHVGFNQRQKELVLIRSALINLQDYVQHTVWVQVETPWKQNEQTNMNKKPCFLDVLTQGRSCSQATNNKSRCTCDAAAFTSHHGRFKDSFTYERFDALQNQVAGDVAWQILAELSDQLGVALVLLP